MDGAFATVPLLFDRKFGYARAFILIGTCTDPRPVSFSLRQDMVKRELCLFHRTSPLSQDKPWSQGNCAIHSVQQEAMHAINHSCSIL